IEMQIETTTQQGFVKVKGHIGHSERSRLEAVDAWLVDGLPAGVNHARPRAITDFERDGGQRIPQGAVRPGFRRRPREKGGVMCAVGSGKLSVRLLIVLGRAVRGDDRGEQLAVVTAEETVMRTH